MAKPFSTSRQDSTNRNMFFFFSPTLAQRSFTSSRSPTLSWNCNIVALFGRYSSVFFFRMHTVCCRFYCYAIFSLHLDIRHFFSLLQNQHQLDSIRCLYNKITSNRISAMSLFTVGMQRKRRTIFLTNCLRTSTQFTELNYH